MSFFDLHCDTAYEITKQNLSIEKNPLAIDLRKGSSLFPWIETFAFWIPDDYRGEEAYDLFQKQYRYFKKEWEQYPELFCDLKTPDQKGCYPLFAVEGGAVLAGKMSHIDDLKAAGISILTLTWNDVNEIAAGAHATGGLTNFGKGVVKSLEEHNIIIDVSHLNEESFWDVARIASRPFIATHSNAYDVCPNPRNLKAEQIRVIRDSNGLIGLNFYKDFLGGDSTRGIEALIRHIDLFLQLQCEDILAIGSDFDGADMPSDLVDITAIPQLQERLISNFGVALTEKIMFDNARNFFGRQGPFLGL